MNLVEFVFQAAREMNRWSETAILYEDRQITYEQLLRLVKRSGGMIEALGIGPGDRVAITASDCPEWISSFLGAIAIGAVAVPTSTMLSPAELRYLLNHCGAKALVLSSDQVEKLRSIRDELTELESVLLIDGEADGMLSLNRMLADAPEAEIKPAGDDTLAFILYTSGSTGPPKGAMHLHRNLPYTVSTCCKQILQVGPEDRVFSSSRLFFAYGLGNSLSFPLSSGATTILCKEKPGPSRIAEIFRQHRPTIFFSVPAVFRALIEYSVEGRNIETDSIKFCISAGEKLPETLLYEWKKMTGLDILDGIGSTEMLQMFISNSRKHLRPGSSGQVVPGYQAKLVDQAGHELTGAGSGHLMIKGGSASPGYWNDPAKTAATMQGEWMKTGDIYHRDDEGYFWFEGRSDDLFKVKGLWVSPIEVEEALLACDGVIEAAVVPGVNHDGMNAVVAYVVLRSEPSSENEAARLKLEVSRRLPPYKCPAEISFMDHLPRTATGKLQRFKLREERGNTE
jgi:benzoate-CoA ligase